MNVRRTQPHARPAAFTLIELLIVIGIIGVVVALGVPLFGVLTGARSQEAGQNLVAAAIGQARTTALNEGKYAGVLFYIDPATERTAMALVVAGAGLEDPDPYDKYKTFVGGQVYRSSFVANDGTVTSSDRAITLTSDATATFRNGPTTPTNLNVYSTTSNNFSNLSNYFGNFRPAVMTYRAIMPPTNPATATFSTVNDTATGTVVRPPRNGPYRPTSAGVSTRYQRIQNLIPSSLAGDVSESTKGTYQNPSWSVDALNYIAPLDGAERQLLPLGVGVQLIIQPTLREDMLENDTTSNPVGQSNRERYIRTGLIMFDPQGRLSLDPRVLPAQGVLGTAMGLTADVAAIPAAVGAVFYDRAAFRLVTGNTDADFLYQNVPVNQTSPIVSAQPFYTDNQTGQPDMKTERAEEVWLDTNTVPLLINRFSGALSEAQ